MESRWMNGNWFSRTGKTETKLPARRGAKASCRRWKEQGLRPWGFWSSGDEVLGWSRGRDINLYKKQLEPRSAPSVWQKMEACFLQRFRDEDRNEMLHYTRDQWKSLFWMARVSSPSTPLHLTSLFALIVSATLQLHMAADWKFL